MSQRDVVDQSTTQIVIDVETGSDRAAPWGSNSYPAWQRLAPWGSNSYPVWQRLAP